MRHGQKTVFGWIGWILACLMLVVVCFLAGGFPWFLYQVYHEPVLPERVDGIVALTGGADRVETAFRLLERQHAPRLLISGVSRAATLTDLARLSNLDPAQWSYKVTVGYTAETTRGNARETAEWAREAGARTLIVVTANYHMPRALLELRRAMPQVTLYPVPVVPPALRERAGMATMSLLAEEYMKYLGAALGFSRLERATAAQDLPSR